MHSNAVDKSQQQCGVLLRRGKCVQRALRGVVTRLRTRRTLVATAVLVLLVLALLALCHARLLSQRPVHRDGAHDNATTDAVADDSTPHVAASPTDRWLLRPDTPHGGSVRVMLLMVSTRVDEQLCYALASAYFADLPVVVIGYGVFYLSHIWRWQVFLDAIQRAGLRDRDVVLLLDSDILFSGEDMLPFIDDYIARSPAAPSALDVRAVRAGTARAPSMFAAEVTCAADHIVSFNVSCSVYYRKHDDAVAAYVARTGVAYDLHNASVQPLRYLNGGVSIHRVWSVRELARALQQYVATHAPPQTLKGKWYDDQSVLALFYNDLRTWEVEHDVLRNSNSTAAATTQRGPHGLRAGQLQLEQTGRLSLVLHMWREGFDELTDVRWPSTQQTPSFSIFYDTNVQEFLAKIWRKHVRSLRLQQRTLTHTANANQTIGLTPPLLSVRPTNVELRDNVRARVYPLILHIVSWYKTWRITKAWQVLPWYVPMRYNATRWQQGRAQVLSSLVNVYTHANASKRVRYSYMCKQHHPFKNEL